MVPFGVFLVERRLRLKDEDIEILFDALTAYCESLLAVKNRDWEKIARIVNIGFFLTRHSTGRRSDMEYPQWLEQQEPKQPGYTLGTLKGFWRRHLEQPQRPSSKRRTK